MSKTRAEQTTLRFVRIQESWPLLVQEISTVSSIKEAQRSLVKLTSIASSPALPAVFTIFMQPNIKIFLQRRAIASCTGCLTQANSQNLRNLVFQQYTYYSAEMVKTHTALSKQYGKLADIEHNLEERHQLHLTRKSKKKLQWSRALTKKGIDNLESQQAWLHAYLGQCHALLAMYRSNDYDQAFTLCSANITPTPYPYSTETLSVTTPWTHRYPGDGAQIRCWDPRDRRLSSPYGSSADSGFYEPSIHRPPFDSGRSTFPWAYNSSAPWIISGASNPRTSFSILSSSSERDDVPELFTATSLIDNGTEPTGVRRRRYSENAIQLIESRHPAAKTHHRGRSVDHISVFHRTGSEDHVVGLYNMAEKRQPSLCDADPRT